MRGPIPRHFDGWDIGDVAVGLRLFGAAVGAVLATAGAIAPQILRARAGMPGAVLRLLALSRTMISATCWLVRPCVARAETNVGFKLVQVLMNHRKEVAAP